MRVETREERFRFFVFIFFFHTSPMNQFLEVDVNRVSNSGFLFFPLCNQEEGRQRRRVVGRGQKLFYGRSYGRAAAGSGAVVAAAPSWYYIYCSRSSIHSSEADVLVVVCRLLSPQGLNSAARQAPASM